MATGWAVFAKYRKDPWEPVSFGRGKEPGQENLLRRGRAAVFPTREAAEAALLETCQRCRAAGHEWTEPGIVTFKFVECELVE